MTSLVLGRNTPRLNVLPVGLSGLFGPVVLSTRVTCLHSIYKNCYLVCCVENLHEHKARLIVNTAKSTQYSTEYKMIKLIDLIVDIHVEPWIFTRFHLYSS